jgi:hypothetical protein
MTRQRPIERLPDCDTDDGYALPPSRKSNSAKQLAPGYLWNGMTQELIPILPEDHPDYVENAETVKAAILRWDNKTQK